MLDFPDAPAVNDVFDERWRWDGVRWLAQPQPGAPGPAGSIGPPGPPGPPGVMGPGVTDGSNAAPGYIGEYLFQTATVSVGTGFMPFEQTTRTLVTLSLSAGDWDVFGNFFCYFQPSGNPTGFNGLAVAISTENTEPIMTGDVRPGRTFLPKVMWASVPWALGDFGPLRVSTPSVIPVYLRASLSSTVGFDDFFGNASLRARRMR